jgi:hypothetical protein
MDGIFLVPFAPFLFVLGIIWMSNQRKLEEKRIAAGMARDSSAGSAQQDARVDELEERVRVLERIVTDGGYDLAHKIEALRDERPASVRMQAREREESL